MTLSQTPRALLLALALLSAACGNNGAAESPPTAAPTAGAATATAQAPATTQAPTPEAAPLPQATAAPEPEPAPALEPAPEPEPEPAPDPEPEPAPAPEPEPHPSGLDIEAIEAAAAEWMEQAHIPGVVLAVARGDEAPWTFGWGVGDLTTQEPMTPGRYVRIGSVTKPVTTVAVLSLAEEGLVDLDTPVTAYLGDDWHGEYEYGPDIALRHLMGHTAGFVEYAFDPAFFFLAAARLNVPISPEEIVRFTTAYGPVADFGTEYHYSTAGHVVAGMVIEAVTGNPAHLEIRSRVLKPLGLENTYLPPRELPPEPVVNSYSGGILHTAFTALTQVPDEASHNYLGRDYIATNSYPQEFLQSAGWTGGGIEAQIGDVPRLFRGLFAGGLISDASLAEMTTPGVSPDYGLGVEIGSFEGQDTYSHLGGTPAFRTLAVYVPAWDLALAATANVLPADPEIHELVDALLRIVVESWGLNI